MLAVTALASATAAENLVLSRDGFFYVGGKPTVVDGREYISGQMYVEVRIPAAKTKPYPIIMVHGGTMSGTNYTGTPVEFVGAPDWFKEGPLALGYGITGVPLTYAPAVKDASELAIVRQDKADAADLVRCYAQQEPARQLPNLQKMAILVLTSEASYHAPYDHCTVKYLQQAGVKPTWIKLAEQGIHGNSHVMMLERNNQEIAAVIARWLERSVISSQ
jgi:hypothetical protein